MPPPTAQSILAEAEAVRAQLKTDMEKAAANPRNSGLSPRGVQLSGVEDGLAWVQGRIDADFILPKLFDLYEAMAWIVLPCAPTRPAQEPQDEATALRELNVIVAVCRAALRNATPPEVLPPELLGIPLSASKLAEMVHQPTPRVECWLRREAKKKENADWLAPPTVDPEYRRRNKAYRYYHVDKVWPALLEQWKKWQSLGNK
jgi:hypothetical protein